MVDIVVCAGNSVARAGLAAMSKTSVSQVVAQVRSLVALSACLQKQRADLAVVEISAPEESEIRELLNWVDDISEEDMPSVLCLIDGWDDMDLPAIKLFSQVLGTGLVSVLPMNVSANQVRDAITAITNGLLIFHPEITETLFLANHSPFLPTAQSSEILSESLTPREIQVLNQLAGGFTNKAIAKTLTISEHTVKFHISAILSKLEVTSRTEAVAVGIRTGLVML
ncbi:MAG: response regulator transcription factor [Cyanobacteria bacterium P01_F01_bin.53]